jgi:PAS domain S-box-containing protein
VPLFTSYGLVVLLVAAATALRWGLESAFGRIPIFLTFYPVLMLAALIGGLGPGLAATGLGALAADYFFIRPIWSLRITNLGDGAAVALFCLIGAFISVITDRLHKAQAEQARRENEEWLRLLQEGAQDYALFMLDEKGRVARWNAGAERVEGWSSQEILGQHHSRFYPQELVDQGQPQRELEIAADAGQYHEEGHRLRKDGSLFWADVAITVIRYADGRLRGFAELTRDITERKRAEEELRQSEERLRALITASSEVVYRMSPDWKEMRQLYGRDFIPDTNEPSRDWLEEYIHPDDQPHVTAVINEAIRTKGIFELEHRVLRADGATGWTFSRAIPLLDENGEIVEWFGAASDITERKQMEEQLTSDLEAMSRLQKLGSLLYEGNLEPILAKIVDAAIAISGADFGNIQLLDPESSDLRIVAQRGFPKWWLDFWNNVSEGQGVCGTALERGERIIVEDVEQSPIFVRTEALEIQLRAGVRAVQSTPLVSRSGRVLGIFSTHFKMPHRPDDRVLRFLDLLARHAADAIDRVQADEALKKAHDELELRVQERTLALRRQADLLELAYNAVIVRDPDSRVVFWNSRAEELYGFTRSEALGRVTHTLLQTQFPVPFEEHMEILTTQGRWEGELIHKRKDGSQIVVLSRQALQRDESGQPAAIMEINLDITELKKTEEETRRYASQLELSNRELQDFAFAASHDLQEPLRKINAFGDQLKTAYGKLLDADGLDYLARMQNAAVRMQALIQALLNYSRVTTKAQPFSVTDLAAIAREVAGDLEASITDTGGRVEIGDLPKIEADPTQMRQLIQNLVGNALKFHGDEKPVVKVYGQPAGGKKTRDGQCLILVEDNGIGFDEKYLDRIFTPFQRLHGRGVYEGTGIGLAICRKIVDRHGGSITARSAPGKGSTFVVTLPMSQPKGGI